MPLITPNLQNKFGYKNDVGPLVKMPPAAPHCSPDRPGLMLGAVCDNCTRLKQVANEKVALCAQPVKYWVSSCQGHL